MKERFFVPDAAAMLAVGERLAREAKRGDLLYLQGNLGAGKTTVTRGFLNAFGIKGVINSPTFTLIEVYQAGDLHLFHFDLYRIKHPDELRQIGLRDYLTEDAICLIEWPEKALDYLPDATRYCTIEIPLHSEGRWVTLK